MEKEGVIDLRLSQHKNIEPKEIVVVSSDEARRFLESTYYWVEILEGFEEKYKAYSTYLELTKGKPKEANHDELHVDGKDTKNFLNVSGDYVVGDKIGRDKNTALPESNWLSKYWWSLIIPVVVIVVAFMITEGRFPQAFNFLQSRLDFTLENNTTLATTTRNISDILSKNNNLGTTLEQKSFLENYKDSEVYGLGFFTNIDEVGETYYVFMNVGNNPVACAFSSDNETRQKLLLLKRGDRVSFSGTFTVANLNGVAWYIKDCNLLK